MLWVWSLPELRYVRFQSLSEEHVFFSRWCSVCVACVCVCVCESASQAFWCFGCARYPARLLLFFLLGVFERRNLCDSAFFSRALYFLELMASSEFFLWRCEISLRGSGGLSRVGTWAHTATKSASGKHLLVAEGAREREWQRRDLQGLWVSLGGIVLVCVVCFRQFVNLGRETTHQSARGDVSPVLFF